MTKQWTPLTDYQWATISPFLPLKRKRQHDLRLIVDAILWLLRTGCQWRNLPDDKPHWRAVYYYFDRWKKDNTFQRISLALTRLDRIQAGRDADPAIASIDSQSVKLSPMIGEDRGLDGNKWVNGRKRQFLVDSGGRLLVSCVHAANEADGAASINLLVTMLSEEDQYVGDRLTKLYGDQAYNGVFADVVGSWGLAFEKASRPESAIGFVPVAKRWVVERTIAWTNFFRRLVKDYEYTVSSPVGWLYLGNIQLMLQRLQLVDQT